MAEVSINEPRNYPTSKNSVHGRYEAQQTREFKLKQAAKRKKEAEARKARRAAQRDRVTLRETRGDADIQKMDKLRKSPMTREQRLARRQALMLKGTSDEKKWRKENKVQSFMPDSESKAAFRNAGAAREKHLQNSTSRETLAISDLGLGGKTGSANATLTVTSYAHSAHQNFKTGNYDQALADTMVASASATQQLAEHSSLVTKEVGEAVSSGAGAAAVANDFIHGVQDLYNGHTVDGADRMANVVFNTLSMAPGAFGVIGKIGTVADIGMNVSGGDKWIQEGYEGEANANYKQINESGRMQARLMAKQSPEYIKAHPKQAAEALRYRKEDAVINYTDEARLDTNYQEIVRIRKSLSGTR